MNQEKYVFSQVMEFIRHYPFNLCVARYQGHYRIKQFTCREQFLAMAFGQLAYRESLRDVVVCLGAQKDKRYHLGFRSHIFLPTLAKANEKRDWRIYRDFAQILIHEARALYIDDKQFTLDLEGTFYVIDATTIELCVSIFSWAHFRKTKAALKLHTVMELKGNIPTFFSITSGKVNDVNFLDDIEWEAGAYYMMDRGYMDYGRWYAIHKSEAFFVTRAKRNLAFKRLYSSVVDKSTGLRCDQVIRFTGSRSAKGYPEKLRRIKYFDKETDRTYVFLTNDFNIEALHVAQLYKHRWQIEIFFKWIKQHLKIKTFWGHSTNAVKTQICTAICAYLVVAIMKKKLNIKRNLYEILQILSVSLFVKKPLDKLFSESALQKSDDTSQKQACLWGF
jgi:hypothetical protein